MSDRDIGMGDSSRDNSSRIPWIVGLFDEYHGYNGQQSWGTRQSAFESINKSWWWSYTFAWDIYSSTKFSNFRRNSATATTDSSESISFDHQLHFVHERDPYEVQHDQNIEDEAFDGLFYLLSTIVKQITLVLSKHSSLIRNPSIYAQLTLELIDRVCTYLFELPTSTQRTVVKWKSLLIRVKCDEFLGEFIKVNRDHFVALQKKLVEQHLSVARRTNSALHLDEQQPFNISA
jgi:hypothetical protein